MNGVKLSADRVPRWALQAGATLLFGLGVWFAARIYDRFERVAEDYPVHKEVSEHALGDTGRIANALSDEQKEILQRLSRVEGELDARRAP